MVTSFLRFAFGFLAIVALALALMFVLGSFGMGGTDEAKAPAAAGSASE